MHDANQTDEQTISAMIKMVVGGLIMTVGLIFLGLLVGDALS